MIETRAICDACGSDIQATGGDENKGMHVEMRFFSCWTKNGDLRALDFCAKCAWKVMQLFGFQYDTGKLLSIAGKEMIDSVTVFGPHGGGIEDIAVGGVAGANAPEWHAQEPGALSAGAMGKQT